MGKIKKSSISKDPSLDEYVETLADIKRQIQESQLKASLAVNKVLISLYWSIGKTLTEKQEVHGWGTNIIDKLGKDLQNTFPGIAGFSLRNIYRMRAFYKAYENLPQAVAKIELSPIFNIPWAHNIVLIEKIKDENQRLWYAKETIENNWSRASLVMWIESDLYARQGKSITNFKSMLPDVNSDLAEQTLKDPYKFDFLMIDKKAKEREIEQGLMDNIQNFLLELGQGFSFVGRQYHLTVGSKDIYIDILFYHLKLRCYVVIELKADEFDAQDLGQINLYIAAVDKLLRHPSDAPTIGLLLCKSKDNYFAEYALSTSNKPIGISSYTTKLVESLPKEFKGKLPTVKEIEEELEKQNLLSKVEKKVKKSTPKPKATKKKTKS